MRCDVCGTESDFDAAFTKDRRFGLATKMVCPSCWVRRRESKQTRFLIALLIAGIGGYALRQFAHWEILGQILQNFFLIGIFVVLSVIPHEAGHAVTAWALGWRVYRIVIGVGRPLFKLRWGGTLIDFRALPIAGGTWITPRNTRWFRTKRCLAILAGPAVNAVMIVVVIWLYRGNLSSFNPDVLPLGPSLFAWANILILIANLWPYQPKVGMGLATDGKQILQTLAFTAKAMHEVQAMRYTVEASICREQGDLAGSRASCDKGLALYPEDPHLLNLSGVASLDECNYEKARETFLKLLAKENQPPNLRFILLNNLAYADALTENPALLAEANAYSQDALKALPWLPSVVGTRGTVLVAMGKYEEGLKLLTRSAADADSPRNKAENCCHIAIAHARLGNLDQARKYLELARQLNPNCKLLDRAERHVSRGSVVTA